MSAGTHAEPFVITPAGIVDGGSDMMAALCEMRGRAVFAYCRRVAGRGLAIEACADAFARFRQTVIDSPDPDDLDLDETLLRATRQAAAERAPRVAANPRTPALRVGSPACAKAPLEVAARESGELRSMARRRLERHLKQCETCGAAEERALAAEQAYRNPPSEELASGIRMRILDALQNPSSEDTNGFAALSNPDVAEAPVEIARGGATQRASNPSNGAAAQADAPPTEASDAAPSRWSVRRGAPAQNGNAEDLHAGDGATALRRDPDQPDAAPQVAPPAQSPDGPAREEGRRHWTRRRRDRRGGPDDAPETAEVAEVEAAAAPAAPEVEEPEARTGRAARKAQQRAAKEAEKAAAVAAAATTAAPDVQEPEAPAGRKARKAQERAAREQAEREAQERAEQEQAAREAEERAAGAAKESAEREARQRAAQEQAARDAQARAAGAAQQRSARQARVAARREAEEQKMRKAEERVRRSSEERAARAAEERARRRAQERAAREAEMRAAREAKERAAREAQEQEQAEREAREQAEREAQEQAEREARERAAREARDRAALQAQEQATRPQHAAPSLELAALAHAEALRRPSPVHDVPPNGDPWGADVGHRLRPDLPGDAPPAREPGENGAHHADPPDRDEGEAHNPPDAAAQPNQEETEAAAREAEQRAAREASERAAREASEAEERAAREAAMAAQAQAAREAALRAEELAARETEYAAKAAAARQAAAVTEELAMREAQAARQALMLARETAAAAEARAAAGPDGLADPQYGAVVPAHPAGLVDLPQLPQVPHAPDPAEAPPADAGVPRDADAETAMLRALGTTGGLAMPVPVGYTPRDAPEAPAATVERIEHRPLGRHLDAFKLDAPRIAMLKVPVLVTLGVLVLVGAALAATGTFGGGEPAQESAAPARQVTPDELNREAGGDGGLPEASSADAPAPAPPSSASSDAEIEEALDAVRRSAREKTRRSAARQEAQRGAARSPAPSSSRPSGGSTPRRSRPAPDRTPDRDTSRSGIPERAIQDEPPAGQAPTPNGSVNIVPPPSAPDPADPDGRSAPTAP